MVNMVQKKIENHLSTDELEKLIKKNKKGSKEVLELIFIRAVKLGMKISDVCNLLVMSEPTGHRWVDKYNEEGLDGLKFKNSNSGRPPKLSSEDKEEFFKIIENEENLTVQRAHQIIKDRYGVDYSLRQVKRIVKSGGYNYGKGYQIYSQKPENAEKLLKKT